MLDLIAELKARGLKITLYPFVMMDIPAGNSLPDPWTGAGARSCLIRGAGRITCDPAPGQAGSPDGTTTAADQVNAFFSGGADEWNYRKMVLHCASLAAAAGGVDAFLIGSELRSLTRVRAASGVYPAVNTLVSLAAEVKAIVGGRHGRHLRRRLDRIRLACRRQALRTKCAFRSMRCGARRRSTSSASTITPRSPDWRDGAGQLDRALTDNQYRLSYLAGNLNSGEGYDWYYADDAARNAQIRTPITDGSRQAVGVPAEGHLEFLVAVAPWSVLATRNRACRPCGCRSPKPIWITEIGCPAVRKGANQPSGVSRSRSRRSRMCRISPTASATI